jgi:superfamily II DNA/RNA helicase
MLKLGFKEDIEWIFREAKRQCQREIQICLFSATVPAWVRQVAHYHMKQNCRIVDLAMDLKNKTAKLVQHLAINCPF